QLPMELQDSSLRLMQRLMCCILVLPPRPQLYLKLLYSLSILAFLFLITFWRFQFKYEVNYDFFNDYFSRGVDLIIFVALVFGHLITSIEMIWRNRSCIIDRKFQELQSTMREKLGHEVHQQRIKFQCNAIFAFLFLRLLVLAIMTLMNLTTTKTYYLYVMNFYSETLEILRCCEFLLHAVLVMSTYQELNSVSCQIILEIESNKAMSIHRIFVVQELHELLCRTQREIEKNFEHSLIVIMLKNFVDTSVIPYWMYVSRRFPNFALHAWCVSEEIAKLLEVILPCWIYTRCDYLQRKLRSQFHGISKGRSDEELNLALLRISSQLAQERCLCRIGGLINLNNEMLGR
ncbi:hypothetical protein KR093_002294, partial [Drosophila rubida]